MHSFTVDYDTISNEESVGLVGPVTSVEVAGSGTMFTQSLSTLLVRCLMKRLGMSSLC